MSRFARSRFWLPSLVWMALIFAGSTDVLSSANTSRFLVPMLRWLKPDIGQDALLQAQHLIRKTGHLTEYGVLALSFLFALNRSARIPTRGWNWRRGSLALGLCVAYAASDELHQSFVASREGNASDVLVDAVGAAAALGLIASWPVLRGQRTLRPVHVQACAAPPFLTDPGSADVRRLRATRGVGRGATRSDRGGGVC